MRVLPVVHDFWAIRVAMGNVRPKGTSRDRVGSRKTPLHSRVATQEIVQSFAYVSWALLVGLGLGLVRARLAAAAGHRCHEPASWVPQHSARASWRRWAGAPTPGCPLPDQLPSWPHPGSTVRARSASACSCSSASGSALTTLRGATARWSGALARRWLVVATLFLGAVGWAGGTLEGLPLFVQLLSLSAVSGGSLAAVILAHWYLVTPRISEQPLVLTTRLLTVALSLQLLLFLVWLAVGYPSGAPFAALTGPQALFVWLRLLVGILFPLLLCWMAWKTALTRSMESATGLLYIELALVLASTIVGAGLAFAVGVLV